MGKRTFLNRQFAFYCAWVVSVVFIAWITALTATADEQKQSGSKKQISPKLSLLLQQLERGPSKDETLTLLKKADLTQAEARQLVDEISSLDAAGRLKALKSRAAKDAKLPLAPPSAQTTPNLEQLSRTLKEEQARKIEVLNKESLNASISAGTKKSATTGQLMGQTHPIPQTQTKLLGSSPRSNVVLSGWSPHEPIVGQNLSIRGSGFGDTEGRVAITFRIGGPRGSSYDCEVVNWSDRSIEVTLPRAIEELYREAGGFSNAEQDATLWVIPPGGVLGAGKAVTLFLDPERFVPRIYSCRPGEITPGSRVTITGKDLRLIDETKVTIALPGRTSDPLPLRVLRSESRLLEVEIDDDVGGAYAGDAIIRISNNWSQAATTQVRFIPVQEVYELGGWTIGAQCFSALYEAFGTYGLCAWGEENRVTISSQVGYGFQLIGQRYTAAYPSSRHTGRSGCYFSRDPSQSSSGNISGEGAAWADADGEIRCTFHVILRGPRGVWPGTGRPR